jgi:hypothetical protein
VDAPGALTIRHIICAAAIATVARITIVRMVDMIPHVDARVIVLSDQDIQGAIRILPMTHQASALNL